MKTAQSPRSFLRFTGFRRNGGLFVLRRTLRAAPARLVAALRAAPHQRARGCPAESTRRRAERSRVYAGPDRGLCHSVGPLWAGRGCVGANHPLVGCLHLGHGRRRRRLEQRRRCGRGRDRGRSRRRRRRRRGRIRQSGVGGRGTACRERECDSGCDETRAHRCALRESSDRRRPTG